VAELEYVPTLVERIAEAIPTELTATAAVGIGGARRLKIARAVLPVVQAELELIVAATRRQVAEEQERHPHVGVAPGRLGGKPCVGGHRLSVVTIARLVWGEGGSVELANATYSYLTRAQVLTACWYLGCYGAPVWRERWGSWTDQHEDAMWSGRWDDVPDPPNAAIARGRGETGGGQ
jgi:uncharacterized protein (DUF433 family)